MWSKPIQVENSDGEIINTLVIDSEGLGDRMKVENTDPIIFSLCVMLSSNFIYNSKSNIDRDSLEGLSKIVNLSEHIQIKSEKSNTKKNLTQNECQQYFPQFNWIIRDFCLELINKNGNQISENEFLEEALEETVIVYKEASSHNEVRKEIKKYFVNRDCVCLPHPFNTFGKQVSGLNKEFRKKLTAPSVSP